MKYLFLFFFISGVAWAGVAVDFNDVLKSWHSATRTRVLSRLLSTDVYAKLNSSFQQLLAGGNLTSVTMKDMYTVPTSLWDNLGVGALATLRKDVLEYVQRTHISLPVKQELQMLLATNVSRAEAVNQLRTLLTNSEADRVKIQLLLEKLGDPSRWNAQNIIDMKHILFYLPIGLLTNIKNESAISELYDDFSRCIETSNRIKSSSCPSSGTEARGDGDGPRSQFMLSLNSWLQEQLYTSPSNWTVSLFKLMNLNSIPPKFLTELKPDVFMSREDAILTTLQNNKFRRDVIGRDVVKRVLADAEVMDSSVSSVRQMLKRLEAMHLSTSVYITDLPAAALDADGGTLRRDMTALAGLAVDQGTVDGEVVEHFMRENSIKEYLSSEEIKSLGPSLLALAPGTTLNATLNKEKVSKENMSKLCKAVRNTAGIATKAKLSIIRDEIFRLTNNDKYLMGADLLPEELLGDLPLRYLTTLFTSHLDLLRRKGVKFNPALLVGLVAQLSTTSIKSLPPSVLEAVAESQLQLLSNSQVEAMVEDMPASSKLGLLVSMRSFASPQVYLYSKSKVAAFLQASDAWKIPNTRIQTELSYIKDGFPTYGACKVLKEKLVNRTKLELHAQSDEEVFFLLTATDIEQLPACVVAAFGPRLLRQLNERNKILLLEKLARLKEQVLTTDSISRSVLEVIIEEGLKAKSKGDEGGVVTGMEAQELGGLLLYAPASVVASVTREGACLAVDIFNTLASSILMPCLDAPHREAVEGLIVKCLREDVGQWSDVTRICCLLHLLRQELLRQVPPGALTSCTCVVQDDLQHNSWAEAREMDCRLRLGVEYEEEQRLKEELLKMKAEAALQLMDVQLAVKGRRRKRDTHDVRFCDVASVTGVDHLTEEELRAATPTQVKSCLPALGSRYMEDSKAQILLKKFLENLDPKVFSELKNEHIKDLNFIMKGVQPQDAYKLSNFVHPEYNDAVAVLGNEEMKFSDEQLAAFADKVLTTWRTPSYMKALDIAAFNRLTCVLNITLINDIHKGELKPVLGMLGRSLDGCDREKILKPLADRAKSIYSYPYNKVQVQELGVIMAGLPPSDITPLSPDAMNGLTPQAVRNMPADVIQVMSPEKLRSLQVGTAQAISRTHGGSLSAEQQEALADLVTDSGGHRGYMQALLLLLPLCHSLLWSHSLPTHCPLTLV